MRGQNSTAAHCGSRARVQPQECSSARSRPRRILDRRITDRRPTRPAARGHALPAQTRDAFHSARRCVPSAQRRTGRAERRFCARCTAGDRTSATRSRREVAIRQVSRARHSVGNAGRDDDSDEVLVGRHHGDPAHQHLEHRGGVVLGSVDHAVAKITPASFWPAGVVMAEDRVYPVRFAYAVSRQGSAELSLPSSRDAAQSPYGAGMRVIRRERSRSLARDGKNRRIRAYDSARLSALNSARTRG